MVARCTSFPCFSLAMRVLQCRPALFPSIMMTTLAFLGCADPSSPAADDQKEQAFDITSRPATPGPIVVRTESFASLGSKAMA
jgi:hypothetical protein